MDARERRGQLGQREFTLIRDFRSSQAWMKQNLRERDVGF